MKSVVLFVLVLFLAYLSFAQEKNNTLLLNESERTDFSSYQHADTSIREVDGPGPHEGIESVQAQQENFTVYPNPVLDKLNIRANGKEAYVKFIMYNCIGKLLLTQEVDFSEQKSLKINVENYPSGLYILKIIRQKGTETKSFYIQ
ncbi:MAG: hypothetical protein C0594_03030 [Marinilabiliales bacterium]|nr:MAG: hypothetical protein C0594_03030 [Marinilabiliales bacterium]